MSTFDELLADETLGRLFGKQPDQARAAAEPYVSVPRSGLHPESNAAFSWLLQGRHDEAKRCLAKLTDAQRESAMAAAAVLIAMAGGARMTQPLPKRLAEPCAYCGKADCKDRWQHDREDRGHEVTWWKAAKR